MALPSAWLPHQGNEVAKPYFLALQQFIAGERVQHQVFPPAEQTYAAFALTPFEAVRVVISVQPGVKLPASLRNIFKELHDDLAIPPSKNGCLTPWAKQGVLLLNTVLTVRAHQANSHRGQGWETFTNAVIERLSDRLDPLIFVLWGKPAQAKKKLIESARHLILEAAHPSPLSAHNGFFGSKPFSKINSTLQSGGKPTIDWRIASEPEA